MSFLWIIAVQTPIGNTFLLYRLGVTTIPRAAWLNIKCATSSHCMSPETPLLIAWIKIQAHVSAVCAVSESKKPLPVKRK